MYLEQGALAKSVEELKTVTDTKKTTKTTTTTSTYLIYNLIRSVTKCNGLKSINLQ